MSPNTPASESAPPKSSLRQRIVLGIIGLLLAGGTLWILLPGLFIVQADTRSVVYFRNRLPAPIRVDIDGETRAEIAPEGVAAVTLPDGVRHMQGWDAEGRVVAEDRLRVRSPSLLAGFRAIYTFGPPGRYAVVHVPYGRRRRPWRDPLSDGERFVVFPAGVREYLSEFPIRSHSRETRTAVCAMDEMGRTPCLR